nr:hypothetical protein CFP56_43834 [Quercus suber]
MRRIDNIDYDDIKLFIKDQTTRGEGKSVSIPGQPDERLLAFENSLFGILADQHHRIDLFVRSKAGEIKRRLDHAKKQLRQLSQRTLASTEQRIPVGRLERYGRLENDVLAAGEEIKSLARFTSTQRTAIRKLLKKYRKWTGSTQLEERFKEEVLEDPKSFTNLDLGPLLDDYSLTLKSVRTLYEERVQQNPARGVKANQRSPSSSVIELLLNATKSSSKLDLDTAMLMTPLGSNGILARYFVHPENIIELQLVLLQHTSFFGARSRSNSVHSPISTTSVNDGVPSSKPDYFELAADDLGRFANEENAMTVNEREVSAGALPQRVQYSARWAGDDEAAITARTSNHDIRRVDIKQKHLAALFNRQEDFPPKKNVVVNPEVLEIRRVVEKASNIQALYLLSACRTRFVGLSNNASNVMLATLDTSVCFQDPKNSQGHLSVKTAFPFAVLSIRQEGPATGALVSILDHSHLAERVRGFSMEYHAAWQVGKSSPIPQPSWATMLREDIRKLPPPALEHKRSTAGTSSGTRTQGSFSISSEIVTTDSMTAVETSSPVQTSELQSPPIRSFRKKRRRGFPINDAAAPQQRYWSEYDHPEEGEGEDDAYVLYIDPNEKSTFEKLLEKLGSVFSSRAVAEEEAALLASPIKDDESSSEEDEPSGVRTRSYGTMNWKSITARGATNDVEAANAINTSRLPSYTANTVTKTQVTSICLIASLIILVVACLLAFTGKHKYATAVDFGVLFAIASSLLFAVLGFASLLRQHYVAWTPWLIALGALLVDVAGCAWLLAFMLG